MANTARKRFLTRVFFAVHASRFSVGFIRLSRYSVSSRHFIKGGKTRVLEMLRRGGINHQAV